MTDKTFGTKQTNVSYTEIKNVYLIAIEKGQLHVLSKADGTVTLLGGKIEDGSSHEDTILGNVLAQTGYDASVEDYVTDADAYQNEIAAHVTDTYYSGALIEKIASTADNLGKHVQISLSNIDKLNPMQQYAVMQCIDMLRADAHGSDGEGL